MTTAELKAMYLKFACDEPDDWPGCLRDMRKVMAAKTHTEAVDYLTMAGWGSPEEAAKEFRGAKPCPTCHGEGLIRETRDQG